MQRLAGTWLWLILCGVAELAVGGCADLDEGPAAPGAADLLGGETGPGRGGGTDTELVPLASDAVLRVHYPRKDALFSRIAVRGDAGGLSWGSGRAMTRINETTWQLRLRTSDLTGGRALEWKPLLDDATWSRGANYRALPGQTVDIYPHFVQAGGRYERRYSSFRSTKLGNTRGVWVYLPPSYDENPDPQNRYPVVYMHDGQNLFDPRYAFGGRTWRVAEALDGGIDALDPSLHLPEVVVVGPENTADRIYEYTPTKGTEKDLEGGGGDLYLDFLISELKPVIDRELRTLPDAAHTALAGSSLGGLITAYAGTKHAAVFGRLGIFSPSTWWDGKVIITMVKASPQRPQRIYVDSGDSGPSGDDSVNTRALADTYRTDLGYRDGVDFLYVLMPGAVHNEDAWAARLPAALRFLLAGL
ncbi:MAG: alpha/beta hydrolase-fold protein [Polyangia bacterium]